MRNLLFFVCGVAMLITFTTAFAHQNFTHSSQSSSVKSDSNSDMSNVSSTSQTSSSNSSDGSGDQRSFSSNSQTSSSSSSDGSGYQRSFTSSQNTSDSSGTQHNSFNLNAANLSQPHILSINTSGNQLTGEIAVNGKVVKRLSKNSEQINLSRFLSVGAQRVKISARYAPASSSVNVELSGPGTNVTQQNSGNGILNYTMDVTVR
ncbi:MAG: hypothetical protein DSM106950_32675 [Stigonema ocellatum SAG 48.90 = DSM 106950]|nr:hypothetical protein [Stigonema ocellatum SAG 48.90 = DSM 106950]